jgi:tetratricopeptide (TPR) repeat protein
MEPDYCFPNRLEELLALESAARLYPGGSKTYYYLGNFWYGNRQYEEAVTCWEKSRGLDENFPTVRRNLSLAYYNRYNNVQGALEEMEAAFRLDPSDFRILMEIDQLYKKLGRGIEERFRFLKKYPEALDYRDDLYLELISLHNLKGEHEEALGLIMKRKFHPWEGGEGKIAGQYLLSNIELAKTAIRQKDFHKALEYLKAAEHYPVNLGEGKLYGAQENDVNYWKGCAYAGLGDTDHSISMWELASQGQSELSAAVYYNDQNPDKIFYQGLALLKLNRKKEADSRFNRLRDYGEKHLFDKPQIDFFAVSMPDMLIWEENLLMRNQIHCRYLMGLGHLGLGNADRAREIFTGILETDPYHTGSRIHF